MRMFKYTIRFKENVISFNGLLKQVRSNRCWRPNYRANIEFWWLVLLAKVAILWICGKLENVDSGGST